jgi:hypothetical protein
MVAAERAAAGFAVECEKCHAPVKPEWPRCVCCCCAPAVPVHLLSMRALPCALPLGIADAS